MGKISNQVKQKEGEIRRKPNYVNSKLGNFTDDEDDNPHLIVRSRKEDETKRAKGKENHEDNSRLNCMFDEDNGGGESSDDGFSRGGSDSDYKADDDDCNDDDDDIEHIPCVKAKKEPRQSNFSRKRRAPECRRRTNNTKFKEAGSMKRRKVEISCEGDCIKSRNEVVKNRSRIKSKVWVLSTCTKEVCVVDFNCL